MLQIFVAISYFLLGYVIGSDNNNKVKIYINKNGKE